MTTPSRQHGTPVLLPDPSGKNAMPLVPIPPDSPPFTEDGLQVLLAQHPTLLPIQEIERAFKPLIFLGREIRTPSGFLDLLYTTPTGNLTLVETKLWKNAESRREVVGQIIDYAKDFARWGFEDLDRAVQDAQKRAGEAATSIVELVRRHDPGLAEVSFQDTVAQNLRRAHFLLIIAGDGIREGVEHMVGYLHRTPGLHFSLALVEFALYRLNADSDWPVLVQPRTVARTTEIVRAIVDVRIPPGVQVDVTLPAEENPASAIRTLTERQFYDQLAANTSSETADQVHALCRDLVSLGLMERWNPASVSMRYPTDAKDFTVLVIEKNGRFYLGWLSELTKHGYDWEIAKRYLNGVIQLTGAAPSGTDATSATPVTSLLDRQDAFLALVRQFTDELQLAKRVIENQ